ncbi:phospholipid transporting ATPase [Sorochytrium milnesiophthora]
MTATKRPSRWLPRRKPTVLDQVNEVPVQGGRIVYVNTPPRSADSQQTTFPRNEVRTTKYTVLSFIPKNLFEQFRRVANSYFLLLVVLQVLPSLQLTSPIVAALPICCIVAATAMKDALEDFRRRIQDKRLNEETTVALSNWTNVNPTNPRLWRRLLSLVLTCGGRFRKHSRRGRDNGPPASAATWRTTKWKDVRVGDFLLLRNNDNVPADVIILSTSEPDGICYVETKSLDGETNLKVRKCPAETSWLKSPQDCANLRGVVEAELPSTSLYTYQGTLLLSEESLNLRRSVSRKSSKRRQQQHQRTNSNAQSVKRHQRQPSLPSESAKRSPDMIELVEKPESPAIASAAPVTEAIGGMKKVPLSVNSLLLRGCYLRNTEWLIGLVVYTGGESKISLNAGITPSKRTRIERQLNPQVVLNFVVLFAMCLVCSFAHIIYYNAFNFERAPFALETSINTTSQTFKLALETFCLSMIIFQSLVPISLYVTVEMSKTFQAYFIHCDEEMYDPVLDKSCSVKSWNLSDDLGQIEYVFSDKTGTLTQNVMELQRCTIAGVVYGDKYHKSSAAERGELAEQYRKKLRQVIEHRTSLRETENELNVRYEHDNAERPLSFVDVDVLEELMTPDSPQAQRISDFFVHLAVCHTVVPEKVTDLDSHKNIITYKAQSPDEAALVETAREMGFTFLNRSQREVVIDLLGDVRMYTVLEILEFTSTRKRMSIIVELADGRIMLYCKGADSIIFERLADGQEELCETTADQLQYFANEGLRTLCIACRELTRKEYQSWHAKYLEAAVLTDDREEAIEAVATTIEQQLQLLGATAIEDKLQDDVPLTIHRLLSAGIKVWVLTGDKLETAVTIGFSCNLLQKSMTLIIVQGDTFEAVHQQLRDSLTTLFDEGMHDDVNSHYALVIDGSSLRWALHEENKLLFLEVGCRCKSVICCRVSPVQKAQVVALVRKELNCLSLAVGDGANDVSMIQEANIGVGIAGVEGYQAVMASDYAISQFKFLQRLLLVHGRWNYRRVSLMNLTFFYKNIIWALVLFWSQFYNGFSADIVFEYSYINYYNTFFTILPSLIVGIFDQDVHDHVALRYPGLYRMGISQKLYNAPRFWLFILDAVWQSLVSYFCGQYLYWDATVSPSGYDTDHFEMGTVMAMYAITTTNIYICMTLRNWTWITFVSSFLNIIVFPMYVWFYSVYSETSPIYGFDQRLLPNPAFWLSLAVVLVIALLPRIIIMYVMTTYFPEDVDIVREIELRGGQTAADEEEAGIRAADSQTDLLSNGIISPDEPPTPSSSRSQLALDALRRPITAMSTALRDVRARVRHERARRRSLAPTLRSPFDPAFLLYMGQRDRPAPNRGFAFSGESGLQGVLSPRPTVTPDWMSDSNVEAASASRRSTHDGESMRTAPSAPPSRHDIPPPPPPIPFLPVSPPPTRIDRRSTSTSTSRSLGHRRRLSL